MPHESPHRPILVVLTSHWVSMAGVALVTLAGFSWLLVLPANFRSGITNAYIGLLAFIAIPIVFFAGLILIPVGIYLGKRRIAAQLDTMDRQKAWRRAGTFFAVMTAANVVIGSQLTYSAVEHMDTNQFCGQTCHVMKPEYTAHLQPPHEAVACATCHIAPGAQGWLRAKTAGTRQLMAVVLNTYPRPIESGLESNRLAPSALTCERCHERNRYFGPRLRTITHFKDDEMNTRTETVLVMMVGGGANGGIHGAHLGPGVRVRYAAADKSRQTIPWVEYTANGVTRTYAAPGAKTDGLPVFEIECSDCHNRTGHDFATPENALDRGLAEGSIPVSLPFIKKTGLALLQASYSSPEEAAGKIPAGLESFYREKYPNIASGRSADIQRAAAAIGSIYARNVFPDLKVTWGTYPNNLGHMDYPGCFRCHDDSHITPDKKTIGQDCNLCHNPLAMDESNPAVLKTLGMDESLLKR